MKNTTVVTNKDIDAVLGGVLKKGEEELKNLKQEDLDKFWYFRYNKEASKEQNLYEFHGMLDLYRRQCRRWEEIHRGSCCVVERVRDTYLWPKIKQFLLDLEGDNQHE